MLCISLSELVSCAFSTIPICPFFNSKNFSFTCIYIHAPRKQFSLNRHSYIIIVTYTHDKIVCAHCTATTPGCLPCPVALYCRIHSLHCLPQWLVQYSCPHTHWDMPDIPPVLHCCMCLRNMTCLREHNECVHAHVCIWRER